MKLSRQAQKVFEVLKEEKQARFEEIQSHGFDQSMVARAAKELEEKNLVKLNKEQEVAYKLTKKGVQVKREGSPEYRLVKLLEEGPKKFSEINIPADVAVGKARQKGWIEIKDGEVSLTANGEQVDKDELVEQLKDENFGEDHLSRGLVERETESTRFLKLTRKGEQVKPENIEEEFNVEAEASLPQVGRKHFYKEVIDYARQQWLEMGFKEMKGPFIVSSFLNFDSLYTPQDHPARELHDTFFLETPEKDDLEQFGEKVERVKQTHEDGWKTGSKGYRYEWERSESEKNVLRTHTTSVSAEKLHEIDIENEDLPVKYFTVSRNFRNETVDKSHLAEFLQTDGIVVGEDLNFKNLKAYISMFFDKMGLKYRIIPSYYPYTEMSIEVQIYDDELDEWIGLGGAGMFRPEVVKPLLGKEVTVLAWGLGIGRIAAKAAGIEDIRQLYQNDIEILEKTPVWRPE